MNVVLKLAFVSLTFLLTGGNYSPDGWRAASDFLKEGYNESANPCEDFANFACGKWVESFGRTKTSQLFAHHQQIYEFVQEAISAIDAKDPKTPKYKLWAKTFFNRCMQNEIPGNRTEGAKQLFRAFAKIMGSPPLMSSDDASKQTLLKENVWKLLGRVQREMPVASIFFSAEILNIENDCTGSKSVLHLLPKFDLGNLLDLETVTNDTKRLARRLGVRMNMEEMTGKMVDLIRFDVELLRFFNKTDIAKLVKANSIEALIVQSKASLEHAVNVETLKSYNPNITWSEYFSGLFSREQFAHWDQNASMILVQDVHFFDDLDDIVNQFDKETVFNYIFYKAYKNLFIYLPTSDDESEPANGTLDNCAPLVIKTFKSATARILLDYFKMDSLEIRNDLQLIMETVLSAFKFLASGSNWLDREDKLKILNKVNSLTFYPGIPDWINNDNEVELRSIPFRNEASITENFLTVMKQNYDRDLDYVIGLRKTDMDPEPELDLNAFYNAMHLELKLAYLFKPLYQIDYPLAVKYGVVGYVLGHEVMHGFDADRIYESPKRTKKWLKPQTIEAFTQKGECLISQSIEYCLSSDDNCIRSRGSIMESLGDIEGLRIAYMAYKFISEIATQEPPLPDFSNLNGEQLFFLTVARSHCATVGDIEYFQSANRRGDVHSNEQARYEVPFRNIPAFTKQFKCTIGSKYAPKNTCNTWG